MTTCCSIVVQMASMLRAKRFNVGLLRLGGTCALLLVTLPLLSMPGNAEDSHPCGNGVELRLSSSKSSQGGLVLVEVHSASPLADLKAEWLGQSLHFWWDGNRENGRRALLGVDLEQSLGRYTLTLAAQLDSGERLACNALV